MIQASVAILDNQRRNRNPSRWLRLPARKRPYVAVALDVQYVILDN
jgi:hypothetical protein